VSFAALPPSSCGEQPVSEKRRGARRIGTRTQSPAFGRKANSMTGFLAWLREKSHPAPGKDRIGIGRRKCRHRAFFPPMMIVTVIAGTS
jgi:hypothetical protein